MTIRSIALIFLIAVLAVPTAFYLLASPPKEWTALDYENLDIDALKVSVPGFSGDSSFKNGFGWIDRTLFFENRLRVLEGVSPKSPGDKKIALVFIERWIALPFSGLSQLRQESVYVRDGYDIIGGV